MSSVERKLVAIMFTDIAGYTAQMSKDQDIALNLLDTKREILKPLIKKNNGTLVKEMGDGTLSHFPSAIDATSCSLELQKNLKDNDTLNIRVGIHLGDTSFRENDVFGDGVNIASRLEKMSPPGGVLVSKSIYDELSSRKGYDGISLGLQSIKGVGRLIEVFGLKDEYLVLPNLEDYKKTEVKVHRNEETPSIAIVPFINKGKEEDVFYAYGISADLISDVTSGGLIRVASKKQIEDKTDLPINELASTLLVRYVATGELWRMGDVFQLSIELFDAQESKILWSDRWEENWMNLPDIKMKLSDGLLKALDAKLRVEDQPSHINTEAYEYYLKGKYKYDKRENEEDMKIARKLLKKSIELDEYFIETKVVLGFTYFESGEHDIAMGIFKQGLKQIKDNPDKINKVTQNIASLHHAIGIINWKEGNTKEAIEHLDISLKNRNDINDKKGIANTYNVFGGVYFNIGDYSKAFKSFKQSFEIYNKLDDDRGKAQALDNLGIIDTVNNNFNHALRHYEKSIQIYKKLDNKRGISLGLASLGILYYKIGKFERALKNYNKALELSKKLNIKYEISDLLNNIGTIFRDKNQFSQALDYHLKSLKIKKEVEDKFGIIHSMIHLGIDYYKIENYKLSILNLTDAIKAADELEINDPSLMLEIKTYLYLSYKASNKNYDCKEIYNLAQKVSAIEFNLSYHIYLLLEDDAYLEKSCDLIQEIEKNLKENEKIELLSYPIPKAIKNEWEKIHS